MISKYLTLLVLAVLSLKGIVLGSAVQLIQANGLLFYTDLEKPKLTAGQLAVFPYSDEAEILLKIASEIKEKRKKKFSLAIDPFCGDGKSGLPLLFYNIAERLQGSDVNVRAIEYANKNAELNYLKAKSCFFVRDILEEGIKPSDAPGNTLWIANPPFGLKVKGADLDVMRDGGENGLKLTLAFAAQAIDLAKIGDVILGVGYSRIHEDKSIELKQELEKIIQKHGCAWQLILLKDQKLWRGFNGKKEQGNPMPISEEIFVLKADPSNQEEADAYRRAVRLHNKAGFNKLAYYAYIIYK